MRTKRLNALFTNQVQWENASKAMNFFWLALAQMVTMESGFVMGKTYRELAGEILSNQLPRGNR